jgi:dihydrofolate reductase
VSTALAAAQGKNVLVLGANVVQQCLEEDLIDEILLLFVPIPLGNESASPVHPVCDNSGLRPPV